MSDFVLTNARLTQAASYKEVLQALDAKLRRRIDATSDARTLASLTKQLLEVCDRMRELEEAERPQARKETALHVIQGKRSAAWLPAAEDKKRANAQ